MNQKFSTNIKIVFLLFLLFYLQFVTLECKAIFGIKGQLINLLLLYPKNRLTITPSKYKLKYKKVSIKLSKKVKLIGWYISADKRTNKNIIFLHGNEGSISQYLDDIKQLHKVGANILIVDYEGFGKSKGEPSITNSINDAVAMYDYLAKKKKIKPENINLFGYSYGGAIATELALRRNVHGIVLQSTFSSLRDIAKSTYTEIISPFVSDSLLNSAENIKKIKVPVVISYAENDDVIPITHSLKLYREANKPKYLFKIKKAQHENINMFFTLEYINLIKKILINSGVS